jgi:hypothetical protein
MSEELDDAKHSLPNMVPVLIALVVIAIVVGALAYVFRSKPVASGVIESVGAVEQNTRNTSFVAINVKLNNVSDKTIYIKDIRAEITTPAGNYVDDAANASDYDRYVAAYPDLKPMLKDPLKVETKVAPGSSLEGTVLVNYPLTKENVDQHTGITVTIVPYDNATINIHGK